MSRELKEAHVYILGAQRPAAMFIRSQLLLQFWRIDTTSNHMFMLVCTYRCVDSCTRGLTSCRVRIAVACFYVLAMQLCNLATSASSAVCIMHVHVAQGTQNATTESCTCTSTFCNHLPHTAEIRQHYQLVALTKNVSKVMMPIIDFSEHLQSLPAPTTGQEWAATAKDRWCRHVCAYEQHATII